jgi:hypothetical protein
VPLRMTFHVSLSAPPATLATPACRCDLDGMQRYGSRWNPPPGGRRHRRVELRIRRRLQRWLRRRRNTARRRRCDGRRGVHLRQERAVHGPLRAAHRSVRNGCRLWDVRDRRLRRRQRSQRVRPGNVHTELRDGRVRCTRRMRTSVRRRVRAGPTLQRRRVRVRRSVVQRLLLGQRLPIGDVGSRVRKKRHVVHAVRDRRAVRRGELRRVRRQR